MGSLEAYIRGFILIIGISFVVLGIFLQLITNFVIWEPITASGFRMMVVSSIMGYMGYRSYKRLKEEDLL